MRQMHHVKTHNLALCTFETFTKECFCSAGNQLENKKEQGMALLKACFELERESVGLLSDR